MSEYIILNCESCKKPVVKIHSELLARIKEALHYAEDQGPHLYHVSCPGGYEEKTGRVEPIGILDKNMC